MWIINTGSIGDHVALTPVVRALREKHPRERIQIDGNYVDAVFHRNPYMGDESMESELPTVTLNPLWRPHEPLGNMAVSFGIQCGVRVLDPTPRLYLSELELEEGRRIIDPKARPVAAVDIWARWPSRRWEAPRFDEMALSLRKRGWEVVEMGDPTYDDTGALPEPLKHASRSLVGRYSLRQTAAALRHCSVYIGNDSGLFHVAAAVGTPQVVLFGPKPWYARAYWNTVPLYSLNGCEPHCLAICHRAVRCLDDIEVSDVVESADLALGRFRK